MTRCLSDMSGADGEHVLVSPRPSGWPEGMFDERFVEAVRRINEKVTREELAIFVGLG